ncbi:MAG: putative RDD family membrane protein YckC [Verrucomicrobiales bacterium]|jgi:uncharacterized RDD family membrane protein YckC
MEFYLLKNGERAGPFKVFHVVEMLRSNEVAETDLGWCSADDQWLPLKEIPALTGLIGDDPIDEDEDEDEESSDEVAGKDVRLSSPSPKRRAAKAEAGANAARPWMRYLARVLDCSIANGVLAFAGVQLGFVSPAVFTSEAADFLTATGLLILSSYMWVFVEAWLLSNYGFTPGKYLFNIRVVREDRTLMSYKQALRRSFTVWLRGYGMGILLLREVLSIMSFIALTQDGKTPWDEQQSLEVVHGGMKRSHWILLFFVTFSLLSLKTFVAYKIDPALKESFDEQIQEMQKAAGGNAASPQPDVTAFMRRASLSSSFI